MRAKYTRSKLTITSLFIAYTVSSMHCVDQRQRPFISPGSNSFPSFSTANLRTEKGEKNRNKKIVDFRETARAE